MKRDHIILGVGIGLIAPFLAYVLQTMYKMQLLAMNKEILPFVIAAALNLLLLRFLFRKDYLATGRGVILATFLSALALIFLTDAKLN